MGISRLPGGFRVRHLARDRRAIAAVEAALVLPAFLTFLFMLFEVAYDQFIQGVLESTVQYTAYQTQVGNTQSTASGQAYVANQLCPNTIAHLLNCQNIYVRVQRFNTAACSDFYTATWGTLPVVNRQLQLGDYAGEQSTAGSKIGDSQCESAAATGGTGFCNPGPDEYVIMSVIYLAPSFVYALFPGKSYTYNGHFVHAALATSAFYTEGFSTPATPVLPC